MASQPTQALVRTISPGYPEAYVRHGRHISMPAAQSQHEGYVAVLRSAGLEVSCVEPDEKLFDCVFIEDTAIVWRDQVLVTRMTEHREGEQDSVEKVLRKTHAVHRLPPDARIEGGDVLHAGMHTYVGLSDRTNQAGADALREFLSSFDRHVVTIPTRHCLHLKSGVTYLGDGTLLAVPGWFDMSRFHHGDVVFTAEGESGAANCLRIGDRLLILDGYPNTRGRIEEFAGSRGIHVDVLNMSEFQKGDGSLTCLSLIW